MWNPRTSPRDKAVSPSLPFHTPKDIRIVNAYAKSMVVVVFFLNGIPGEVLFLEINTYPPYIALYRARKAWFPALGPSWFRGNVL